MFEPQGGGEGWAYVGYLIDFCSPPLGIWLTPSPEGGDIWIDSHFASLGRACVEDWGKQLSRQICVPNIQAFDWYLLPHGREFNQTIYEKSNAPHMPDHPTLQLNFHRCIIKSNGLLFSL